MRVAHWVLVCFYLLLPVAAGAVVAVRSWQGRSFRHAQPFLLTTFSATIIATCLVVIYALAADAKPPVGQILLAAYFGTGMLLTLKGLNWGLQWGLEHLCRLRARPQTNPPAEVSADTPPLPSPKWLVERKILATLLRAGLLFAVGLPYVIAVAMIYRPKVIGDNPRKQFGLPFETVYFDATDDSRVEGWWVPAGKPRGTAKTVGPEWGTRTVILCHGLGASKANQLVLARELVAEGYNLLAIDLRAHGGSGGQLTSFGDLERHDVLGAVRWLRTNKPTEARRINGLGVSMGAAALIAAAGDDSPEGRAIDAVAVYCTYDDLGSLADEVAKNYFSAGPMDWLVTHLSIPIASAHVGRDLTAFAPAEHAKRLAPRPILVIHGKADPLIGWGRGLDLYRAAWQPKYYLWVDGADHNAVLADPKAGKAVKEFFDGAVSIL